MTNSLRSSLSLLVLAGSLSATACGDDDKPKCTDPTAAGCGPMDGGGGSPRIDAAAPQGDARVPGNTGDAGGPPVISPDGSVVPPAGGDSGVPDAGVVVTVCDPTTAPVLPALKLQPVAGITADLNRLVYAAQAPGSSDWYLVMQTGTVRVLSNGIVQPTPFLDVTSQIAQNLGAEDERGLLSIAFPPDYATSNKFYVGMTPTQKTDGFPVSSDVVVEYQKGAGNAPPMRQRTMVQLPASEDNHNGGTIVFSADGLMYYGTGDGGNACNLNNEAGDAQDVSTLFGKILRLDPKVTTGTYAAASNPFVGVAGADARVLHYGLRNPFRYSIDRANGDLYIGDVGQGSYEEADRAPAGSAGLNFGWPKYEGAHADTCGDKPLRAGSTVTPPIVEINRVGMNAPPPFGDYISIIGGYVYRGSAIPALQGVYLFGDYQGARYGALRQCGDKTSPITPINRNRDPNAPNAAAFVAASANQPAISALTAIIQDNDGELYFVANRNSLLKVVAGP